jgi:UDP-N-acetylglucosamine/UDP-N-acetylgalactosamine diphosphorylase
VDLEELGQLISDIRAGKFKTRADGRPEFPPYLPLPSTPADFAERKEMGRAGEALIRAGKVAVLTVAGGQGTRLRYEPPKGTYLIGAVSRKSLCQIQSERIMATGRRYGLSLPWYIMTSDATDIPTREFFRQADYFGLPPADVQFFCQRMMPSLDRSFRIPLIAKDEILISPNGHGGTLLALAESGMLDDMMRRGIEEISYFQVDNPLVPAADPVFLGYHSHARAQMSSKALWKREPEEPVGAFVRLGDRIIVREYSDLTKEQMYERTPDGKLVYGLGSIAIHAIRVDFVRRLTAGGFKLPFHLAEKNAAVLDDSGQLVKPEGKNVYKFETFVFDALYHAERSVVFEICREEEFSPVKNAVGKDSPETCRRDMSALYANWLAQAGADVPRDAEGRTIHPIEISPLFALDLEELAAKIPRGFAVTAPLYLSPETRS